MEKQAQPPRVLIPEVKLQARIQELANQINADYQDKEIIFTIKKNFTY